MVEELSERVRYGTVDGRFGDLLDAVAAGVTVQDSQGRLVYANRAAAALNGWDSPDQMLAASPAELLARFELMDEAGRPLPLDRLPGRRLLAGEEPEPLIVGFRIRATGEERWAVVRATPLGAEDGTRLAVNTFHDLTPRVQAEREVRARERRYREIVDALPVVAWLGGPDGTAIAANGRWLEYTGAPLVGGRAVEQSPAVHPDDREALVVDWRRAVAATEPYQATVRLRRHDGVHRWHLLRAAPLWGDAGTLEGWIGTLTDINDERQASMALLDSERQFRDLTDSAPMLVWMSGVDHGRTFFNRGWLEFRGRTMSEEVGLGWREGIHPEDVARCDAILERARDRRQAFEAEYRLRRHDGLYRWILDIGAPRHGPDGEFIGFVGSCVDIEARKRVADLARLMADAGLRLDETRDLQKTLDAAAALAIPDLADWCIIDLVEPDGSLRRAAVVAADPEHQAIADDIRDFPTPADSARPGARAVGERRPILIEDLRDEAALRGNTAGQEALAEVIRRMKARSAIVQPLTARGETIGAMFFVVGPDRSYSPADVVLTTELAGRVALAISNVLAYDAEQRARQAAEAAVDRTERLQRLTRGLAAASTRGAVVDLVVREGRAALGASGAVIALRHEQTLDVVAIDGYARQVAEAYTALPVTSRTPLAVASSTSEPVWLPDVQAVEGGDDGSRDLISSPLNASACAVPLIADGHTFGALGLSFANETAFGPEDRALISAYADLCAQALARVALVAIRERLVADLEAERARLEALLRQMPEGLMIAEAPSGRVVLGNDRLEEIVGVPARAIDHLGFGQMYRGFDEAGRELTPTEWPLARAVRGETVPYTEIELLRPDGNRVWIAKRAGPVLDREGRVVAGVATVVDISEARRAREIQKFLADATELLGSSLDYEDTIRRVADLAVPRIADWCAVEILDEQGVSHRIAVAHSDPEKLALALELLERYPPDPASPHGVAAVLRTGRPDLMTDLSPEMMAAAARDDDHRELLRALDLRSYMIAPLIDGGRVLGAMTFVSAESGRRFSHDDLAFAEDVAARAAAAVANARLFRQAVRYKSILDATLDAVVMFDPLTLRISYANRGATDQLGYTIEELIGTEATMFIEDLDVIGLRGIVAELVSGDREARTETMAFRDRDGRSIPVEVLLQHVAPPGEPGRIVAVSRDIADRIEAQASLRRLAESEHARAAELNAVIRAMGEGVVVCTADGRIALANPAAEAMFPETDEQTYADLLAQVEDPGRLAPALGTAGGPIELRARATEERWIELSTYPVVRPDDEAVDGGGGETIVLLRDVTEARQRQAIRDTFIGVLSHELRTPVTTIFAGSKVLARDADQLPEETRREIFSDIVVESERLHRLVEDVIAMTRFGEDEGEVGTEPVLIQRVLPVVIRSEESRWPGVRFELDVPPGLPTVVADQTYVEQVVRNLVSNAAKYGGAGTTVQIQVDTVGNEPAGEPAEVRVRIVDDGPGFPPDEAERVFELFFRSARTANAAAGAGIGLFVCARLIRAMGGRIWATPRPGRGAEFGFTLRVMPDTE